MQCLGCSGKTFQSDLTTNRKLYRILNIASYGADEKQFEVPGHSEEGAWIRTERRNA